MSDINMALYSVIAFLIVNLILGLRVSRNIKTIEEYALGKKLWSSGALIMTYLATTIGDGYIFRIPNGIYSSGIGLALAYMGMPLADFIKAKFLYKYMSRLRGCLSIGDVLERFYGPNAKYIGGILSLLFGTVVAGLQLCCIGVIFDKFLGFDFATGIVLGGIVLALYTSFGGMKSIVYTDLLQLVFVFIVILLLAAFVINKAGGMEIILEKIDMNSLFPEGTGKTNKINFSLFLILGIFMVDLVEPARFQRILMVSTKSQLKKVFYKVSIINFLLWLTIIFMILAGAMIYPNLDPDNVFLEISNKLLAENYFLKNIFGMGFIALMLSTADSHLHASGISFSHDLISPLLRKFKIDFNPVLAGRIGTLILSAFAIWFSLNSGTMFSTDYIFGILGPTLSCPIIFGILGLRAKKYFFEICSFVGVATFFICKNSSIENISIFSVPIAIVANGLTFLVLHFISFGKISIEHLGHLTSVDKSFFSFKDVKKTLAINKKFTHHSLYSLFGLFFFVSILTPYLFWGKSVNEFFWDVIYLRIVATILCVLLMTNATWKVELKKYAVYLWYFTLTFCLPFLSLTMLFITNAALEYVINIAITIMFLLLLVDWISATFIMLGGTLGAVAYCSFYLDIDVYESLATSGTLYLLTYQVISATVIGVLFSKKKQSSINSINSSQSVDRMLQLKYKIETMKATQNHQKFFELLREGGESVMDKIEETQKFLNENQTDKTKESLEVVKEYMDSLVTRSQDYLKLNPVKIAMETLPEDIEDAFFDHDSNNSVIMLSKSNEIRCDRISLVRILNQLMMDWGEEARRFDANGYTPLTVYISDSKLTYTMLNIPEYRRTIDAITFTLSSSDNLEEKDLKSHLTKEVVRPKMILPISTKEVASIVAERNLEAHYGMTFNDSNEYTSTMGLCIPRDVYEIRPKNLDIYEFEELLQPWQAADDLELSFKKEAEKIFPNLDKPKLEKALAIIKKYHSSQKRKSGEPYYMHPIHVAKILLEHVNEALKVKEELHKNADVLLCGALMHDILEDTPYHPLDMKVAFGTEITNAVIAVTKVNYENREMFLSNEESFSKIGSQGTIAVVIKLADRLHNLMTIDGHSSVEKRKSVAEETLKYFIHPAKLLGFQKLADQLQNTSEYILKHGKIGDYKR